MLGLGLDYGHIMSKVRARVRFRDRASVRVRF